MIRLNNNFAKILEFTSFKKKETVSDDQLMNAVLNFETALSKQKGIISHCLVRNFKNEYANVLFVENREAMNLLHENVPSMQEAMDFMELIEMESVKMEFHEIFKNDFSVPQNFACVKCGTFFLKEENTSINSFINASNDTEKYYLNTFDNHLGHFVGNVENKKFSEITIGKTYAKTKQECFGYAENPHAKILLDLANLETLEVDFWYLVA